YSNHLEIIQSIHQVVVIGKEKDANFDIVRQDFNYRLTLCAQFVRRDFFLKKLTPGKNIWQYETQFKAAKHNGAQILTPKQEIAPLCNIVKRGKIAGKEMLAKIKKEDWDALKQLGISTFKSGGAV
ncbi:unnamed protein product, partial [marine sediment metagenome]